MSTVEIHGQRWIARQHRSVTIPSVLGTEITHDTTSRQVAAVPGKMIYPSLGQQQMNQYAKQENETIAQEQRVKWASGTPGRKCHWMKTEICWL